MNKFVEQYKKFRNEGAECLVAFGAVATGIAMNGTIEDLKQVERVYQEDSNREWEEIINERSTTAV